MKFANTPIRKNIIANLFGIGVNLLNQIVLVPIYLLYWGTDLYSDWIVISAVMVIFSMSDIGLNNVIQNRFSMKLAENDKSECVKLLTNNWVIVTSIFIIAVILSVLYLAFFNIETSLGLHCLTCKDASIIFLAMIFKVFLGMYSGIASAIYRATHNASRGVYIDQFGMLMVFGVTITALLLHCDIVYISILICLPPLFVIIYKHYDASKYFKFRFRARNIDLHLLKNIFWPSISFMSFPLGNAIVLQGYTLLANKFFGADGVVLYNTTRTLCNFLKTFLGSIQNSVWPEYSIAYGERNFERMRHLHYRTIRTTMLLSIVISLVLLAGGSFIFKIWTHGEINFSFTLMSSFLIVLFIEMLWNSSGVTLMATNNHVIMGVIYIAGALTSFGVAVVACTFVKSLSLMTITLVILQITMALYTIKRSLKITNDNVSVLIRQVLKLK